MKEIDNLLAEGMENYAEAMYAVRHFERIIVEKTEKIADRRMEVLLNLFDQEDLHGPGEPAEGPGIRDLPDLVPEQWWCSIGLKYWIESRKGCGFFIGLIMAEGSFSAAVYFSPQRAPLRDWLVKVFIGDDGNSAYLEDGWYIVVPEPLKNGPANIESVSAAMERAIDRTIETIEAAGGWDNQE